MVNDIKSFILNALKRSNIYVSGSKLAAELSISRVALWKHIKALKEAGNYVISIIGGRTRELVILENEMRAFSDEVYTTTDDGSYGFHGLVTDKLQELIDNGKKIDFVLAIGPVPMMSAVAEVTRPYNIKTVVSLNSIMVDGTGMCGGCRAIVGGKTVFVCVEGPEFDAHQVDFKVLNQRNKSYIAQEQKSLHNFECYMEQNV